MVDKYGAVNFTTDISKTTSRFLLLLDCQAPTFKGCTHVSRRLPTVITRRWEIPSHRSSPAPSLEAASLRMPIHSELSCVLFSLNENNILATG